MFPAHELHAACRSHAHHYLRQLQIADALFRKGGQQITRSLAKFDQDWSQIEQGQAWAAHSPDDEQAARLCCEFALAGADLFNLRQAVGERVRWFEAVLAAARRIEWRSAESDVLIHLGRAYWQAGRVNDAINTLTRALDLSEANQYCAGMAKAHQRLGEIQASQSAYDEARQHGAASLALYEELNDQRGLADILCSLGNLALLVDDYPEASALFERSRAIYQALGHRIGEANVLSRLGSLAGTQRDFALAERHFTASRAIYAELHYAEGLGQTANMLGTLAIVAGRFAQAEAWFQQSLSTHMRLGNQDGIAAANLKLGEVDQYTGQLEQARQHFQLALDIYQGMNNLYNVAGVAFRLGNVALIAQDDAEAERRFRQSIDLCRAIDRPLVAASLSGLAQIACRQGRYAEAERFFAEGMAEAEARGDTWIIADLHQEWGNMALEINDRPGAKEHFRQALDLALEMETTPLALSILGSIAHLLAPEQPETALEIACFVSDNPASLQNDKDQVCPLIESLQDLLGPEIAAQRRARAQTATLEMVTNSIFL